MKSPEEKAKELVDRFYEESAFGTNCHYCFSCAAGYCRIKTNSAKACALICCDETLKNGCTLPSSAGYYGDNEEASKYHLKVKEEIKKL